MFGRQVVSHRVLGDWVTNTLLCPIGKLLYYVHEDYLSVYEQELSFTVNAGRLLNLTRYDNRRTIVSPLLENARELSHFLCRQTNWQTLGAALKSGEVRKVVIAVDPYSLGRPAHIEVLKADGDLFTSEALRLIKLIPIWTAVYRRGRYAPNRYMVPVVFSKEKRESCR
ncbi:hypothetical protein GCM10023187_04220 [Nibrella viscosa]|uniref:TonB C-terminal domain-containing protein n=1 Tax=Nibrella viscosa TaxID=1084524 RepID=A0ABP8JUI8_9BACT